MNPSARSESFVGIGAAGPGDEDVAVGVGSWDSLARFVFGPTGASTGSVLSSANAFSNRTRQAFSVVPNRHNHCSQALHHASLRLESSSTPVDVQMGLGPGACQSLTSSSLPRCSKEIPELTDQELLLDVTWCNDFAF